MKNTAKVLITLLVMALLTGFVPGLSNTAYAADKDNATLKKVAEYLEKNKSENNVEF